MTLTDRLPPSLDDPDALVEAFGEWAFDEQGLSLYPAQRRRCWSWSPAAT